MSPADLLNSLAQARAALKAGEPREALRLYALAEKDAPRTAEIPHERGLAHLELGEVGLAALAQRRAIELDSEHSGARAQLAAALQALGDDGGAARELAELLARIGPQPALAARRIALEDAARDATQRRLLGSVPSRVAQSPLVASAMARLLPDALAFRSPFAELRGDATAGMVRRLDLVFESMDASMGRSDLSYGGATVDEEGRRVPLDEFSAAAIVFLAEALGIDTTRARRLLRFLLTPECGLAAHRIAGANVGWTLSGEGDDRRYGLFAEL
jgi:tetratricopeptide (TPR) repeat protein